MEVINTEKIKPSPCPICGASPIIEKNSLFQNGHGYYGCYELIVKCPNCDLPHKVPVDNIYYEGDLYELAIKNWEKEVLRIKGYLKKNYKKRKGEF